MEGFFVFVSRDKKKKWFKFSRKENEQITGFIDLPRSCHWDAGVPQRGRLVMSPFHTCDVNACSW